MKPRILYAAFDVVPSPKGASTHITHFVRGLVEAGCDVTLITAGDPGLPERESYYGADLLRAPAENDFNFLRRALAFGRYVLDRAAESGPFDLVHVRSIWSGRPLAENRAGLAFGRLLYEVNGLPSVELKYHYPAIRGGPLVDKIEEWELATLAAAESVICPSQVTARYLVSRRVDGGKIQVIPNGVDPALFKATPVPNSPEKPTLLYVGTLAEWQGLDTLIRALPLVREHRPVQARIVGRGRKRQRKAFMKLARKVGVDDGLSIERAVTHEAVPDLIASADLCLAPLGYNDRNVSQGCCPIKILEYMACGRPVVAADLPVVRELARPGEEALLFIPDDPADLARQILVALERPDETERMARRGAERARREFSWDRAREQLLDVYRCLGVPISD